MLNVVELLMVEHVSLRLRFRLMREQQNFDSICAIEEFVRTCHAKVEDELVFPILRDLLFSQGKQKIVEDVLRRLEADHKLIDTIGEQIKLRTIQGDSQTLTKRIALYCSTVESHNSAEEIQLFPFWSPAESQERDAAVGAVKIMNLFGMNRYYELTGISKEFLGSLTDRL